MRLGPSYRVALLVVALASRVRAGGPEATEGSTAPEDQYLAILQEYEEARTAFGNRYGEARTPEERAEARRSAPDPRAYAGRLLNVADRRPNDPAALDCLIWVVENVPSGPEFERALVLIARDRIASPRLAPTCEQLGPAPSGPGEAFLRAVLAGNPHRLVKGTACYVLAQKIARKSGLARRLRGSRVVGDRRRLEDSFGRDYVRGLAGVEPDTIADEAGRLFERSAAEFGDIAIDGVALAVAARSDLSELRNLAIGKVAPEVEGTDLDGRPMRLGDFRGKVVVLDFWGHW